MFLMNLSLKESLNSIDRIMENIESDSFEENKIDL